MFLGGKPSAALVGQGNGSQAACLCRGASWAVTAANWVSLYPKSNFKLHSQGDKYFYGFQKCIFQWLDFRRQAVLERAKKSKLYYLLAIGLNWNCSGYILDLRVMETTLATVLALQLSSHVHLSLFSPLNMNIWVRLGSFLHVSGIPDFHPPILRPLSCFIFS